MVGARFKGPVSKKVKSLPLLINHLDRALSETTLERERNIVFANLYDVALEAKISSTEGLSIFYLSLPENSALSFLESCYENPNPLKVIGGKNLAEELREAVIIPRLGHKRYSSRMLQARHDEYSFLLNYSKKQKQKQKEEYGRERE